MYVDVHIYPPICRVRYAYVPPPSTLARTHPISRPKICDIIISVIRASEHGSRADISIGREGRPIRTRGIHVARPKRDVQGNALN